MSKSKVRWYKNPRPVVIGWQDAQSIKEGWQDPSELRQWAEKEHFARIKTSGFLMGESKSYYIITACTQCDGDFYTHVQRIPKGCVTDLERLKRGKQKWCHGKLPKAVRR